MSGPSEFTALLQEKTRILVTSVDYLREIGAGNWYLVLHPQVAEAALNMAEPPVETFVGRQADLEKLHAIVQSRRTGAITGVTGTGGIGKTELARMYAKKYGEIYTGGVFWVSLKGSDWKSEAERVFAALRPGADPVVFPDGAKAKEETVKILNRKEALLIIDNVDEAEDIILPACSVLVTTRNKEACKTKTVRHESIYPLDRFDATEGTDLLKEILGEPRVDRDRQGAERLVEVLGGMPLAIEIAAKHLDDAPDITFPDYIGWVNMERLKLEDDPDKNVIASITLSLDFIGREVDGGELLNLFYAAGVCAESGFTSKTLGSAAGFSDSDTMRVGQLVGKLHRRSLLEFSEQSNRYSMHPLVRRISEKRLEEDPEREKEFSENHCRCFLRYAEANEGNPQKLIMERDALRLAMIQAMRAGWEDVELPRLMKALSGPYRVLFQAGEYDVAFRYLVASGLIDIHNVGRSSDLIGFLGPLLEKRNRLQESNLAFALNNMGIAYFNIGEYRKAIGFFEQALELARRIGDERGEGSALGNIGIVYCDRGEYHQAIVFHEQRLELARRIGDERGEGSALCNIGIAYKNLGEYSKAIGFYEQALALDRRIGDLQGEGITLGNMGNAYLSLGEYHRAIEFYEQQLEITRRINDIRGEGADLGSIGSAYLCLGEYLKAIGFF